MNIRYYYLILTPDGGYDIVISPLSRLMMPVAVKPISGTQDFFYPRPTATESVMLDPVCDMQYTDGRLSEKEQLRNFSDLADALKVYFLTRHEYPIKGAAQILSEARIREVLPLVDVILTSEGGLFEVKLLHSTIKTLEAQKRLERAQ